MALSVLHHLLNASTIPVIVSRVLLIVVFLLLICLNIYGVGRVGDLYGKPSGSRFDLKKHNENSVYQSINRGYKSIK